MANKTNNKKKIIAAPVALTDEEVQHFGTWLALTEACGWLVKEPKDDEAKDVVRGFMTLYAKIKMARQKAGEENAYVRMGKCPVTGEYYDIQGGWYDTPEQEAHFVTTLFMSYFSSVLREQSSKEAIARGDLLRKRIKKLEEDIERRDLRIQDLENAVKKSEAIVRGLRSPDARAQGRLPGKRANRVKAVPVKFKGKKRG